MTDNHNQPLRAEPRTEFMFKRFFDRPSDLRGEDPELQEAEQFWRRLGGFSVPNEYRVSANEPRSWHPCAIFASVLLIFLLIGASIWLNMPTPAQPWRSFATHHAGHQVVMLEDGSTLSLAAESRVDVRFSGKERQLRLVAGQALFEVAHDEKRPFMVQAGNGIITAVGTAFDIRLDRKDTQVTVVKGIVDISMRRLDATATIARARRGDQVKFSIREQNGSPVAYVSRRSGVDLDSITSWTRGKLFFDGEPLEEAISLINTYASKKLVLKNPAYASMPVYGLLDQGDVQGLLVLVGDHRAIAVAPE